MDDPRFHTQIQPLKIIVIISQSTGHKSAIEITIISFLSDKAPPEVCLMSTVWMETDSTLLTCFITPIILECPLETPNTTPVTNYSHVFLKM